MNVSGNKKWFTISNMTTTFVVVFVLTTLFSPDFKGLVIKGFMKVGFFQPDIPESTQLNPGTGESISSDQISFADATGARVQLADLKGKVLFINFWATWCPPCLAEMPSIDKLASKYRGRTDVVFIMVDVDGNIGASTTFMKKHGYNLPVSIPASQLPKEYFSGSLPTTVIIDKAGRIAFRETGAADYGNPKVAGFIDQLARQ